MDFVNVLTYQCVPPPLRVRDRLHPPPPPRVRDRLTVRIMILFSTQRLSSVTYFIQMAEGVGGNGSLVVKAVFPLKQKRTDPNRPDPTKNGNENSAATNN